jgi:hypothetical protein
MVVGRINKYVSFVVLFLGIGSGWLSGQSVHPDSQHVAKGVVHGEDTLAMVELEEVSVYESGDYSYLLLKRKYRRLIRNVKKAYPYAKIAGEKLQELDSTLAGIESEKERKETVARAEKAIMEEFEKDMISGN